MLRISKEQMYKLGHAVLLQRSEQFARLLRRDFAVELAEVEERVLRDRVSGLIEKFYQLRFKESQHLYRLVAWGLFLGDDYLEQHDSNALIAIARSGTPEEERFQKIRAILTVKGPSEGVLTATTGS